MFREYLYVNCPQCGKKLFKITKHSRYYQIFVWCKLCKKEFEFTNIVEPMSHCK